VRAAYLSACASCLVALACSSPPSGKAVGQAEASASSEERDEADKAEARERIKARLEAEGMGRGPANKNRAQLPPLPEVVATVAGHDIPRREFELRYDPLVAKLLGRRGDGHVPGPYQASQRKKIIGDLVWSKQLELEAARSGVDFEPEALTKQEAEERRHVRDWDAWLARIGQTPAIRHQANVDYLRERALLAARIGSLEASEAELRAAYEEHKDKLVAPEPLVRASHLLITYGPRVGDEKIQPTTAAQHDAASEAERAQWNALAKARAEALRAQVLDGAVDFNEFAREWSEGPGAFRGGDMGLFPRRQMVEEYATAAFALEPGQISEPIESKKGYYVIKSFGRYDAGPLPFEAVRADLVRQVEADKYREAHAALEADLGERFEAVSPPLDEARAFLE
jgi:peptidyl-prolyl cis-trans isomerase C